MSAPQKRDFVALARQSGLSERRACRLAGQARSVARYRARPRRVDEAALVERLKQIAGKKRRRGYRLAHRELRRQGWSVNHKRVWRLWKREGLSVPARKSRKRIRGVCVPRAIAADRPNAVWCLDFLEDRTLSGRRLRILCVTDEFTRESLAIETGICFRSERVCSVLEELLGSRGVPAALRMDNGPEFVALTLRGLCHRRGIDAAYIEPGRAPTVPEAVAERTGGEFPCPAAGRVFGWGGVFVRAGRPGPSGPVAKILQRGASAFAPALPNAGGVCVQVGRARV